MKEAVYSFVYSFIRSKAKEAKAAVKVSEINALLVPEKVGHPNGLQLMFDQNGDTRSIYLYSDSGKVSIVIARSI